MGENEYFEYYDYETKKFQILTIFTNSNIKQKELYQNIINHANTAFLYYGKFHTQKNNKININISSYVDDNKIYFYEIDKNIRNNINNFLSVSVKKNTQSIKLYYILNNYIGEDIIITKKYKLDGSNYENTFQLYSNSENGYFPNEIYYTLEEYKYRPHHYTIIHMVHRIFILYTFIFSFLILSIYYFFIL